MMKESTIDIFGRRHRMVKFTSVWYTQCLQLYPISNTLYLLSILKLSTVTQQQPCA